MEYGEGAARRGVRAAPRSWKSTGDGFLPRTARRKRPANPFITAQGEQCRTSNPQHLKYEMYRFCHEGCIDLFQQQEKPCIAGTWGTKSCNKVLASVVLEGNGRHGFRGRGRLTSSPDHVCRASLVHPSHSGGMALPRKLKQTRLLAQILC